MVPAVDKSTSWAILPTPSALPKLLVKTSFSASGYTIHLTDLSRVWRETLFDEDVNARAVEGRCSIDPSDDNNRKILFEHIRTALEGSKGTSLEVCGGANGDNIEIVITASLPSPLPKLRWTCRMTRLDDTAIASQLVEPLIRKTNNLHAQISQLVHELATRDHVIAKICDRLEASGDQLTTVFPGKSNIKLSRRRTQREQLAPYVPGLAEFDESAWRGQNAEKEIRDVKVADLDEILKDLPIPEDHFAGAGECHDWWKGLSKSSSQTGGSNGLADQHETSPRPSHGPPTLAKDPSAANSELERPSTASSLGKQEEAPTNNSDDSTEDEDDLDQPSNQRGISPPRSPSRRTEDQAALSSSLVPPNPRPKLGQFGGRKAVTPVIEQEPDPPKTKARLGVLGGRPKTPPTAANKNQAEISPPSKTKPKLGTFGGKAEKPSTDNHGLDPSTQVEPVSQSHRREDTPAASTQPEAEDRSRAHERMKTEQIRETSEERADRKRNELKRELEDKARVAVKKKRKF